MVRMRNVFPRAGHSTARVLFPTVSTIPLTTSPTAQNVDVPSSSSGGGTIVWSSPSLVNTDSCMLHTSIPSPHSTQMKSVKSPPHRFGSGGASSAPTGFVPRSSMLLLGSEPYGSSSPSSGTLRSRPGVSMTSFAMASPAQESTHSRSDEPTKQASLTIGTVTPATCGSRSTTSLTVVRMYSAAVTFAVYSPSGSSASIVPSAPVSPRSRTSTATCSSRPSAWHDTFAPATGCPLMSLTTIVTMRFPGSSTCTALNSRTDTFPPAATSMKQISQ
mmetsp:Transcript_1392/g.3362  ORF Transcript_1392/g.3362 Transcript_1392/m.3362 type:complete len:274 (-) Transcript_1392:1402-2223(-)